jgi:hypothetical protein
MVNLSDLIDQGYDGCSVRSIVTDPTFRETVINDPAVRGNVKTKEFVLDKIAVGGKVLITGPTGEAKTLFARILLNHITREISSKKFHIKNCPFLEDAGYLIKVIENFDKNILNSIDVLQSLCPYCRVTIETVLGTAKKGIALDNTEEVMKISKKIPELLKQVEVEKTVVRQAQIDPRNDPDSLYMLLAGSENLEQLFSDKTQTTFDLSTHKVGTLSRGFLVVNEIQRLHLTLLESLMGFLEDPQGIKYNLAGQSVYVDGVIIFTSNAPLTVFGEESQPIINRIPEVLWPARDVRDRTEIVKDMFEDHLIITRKNITSNPTIVRLFELTGEGKVDFISRIAYEFVAHVASESIPKTLKIESVRAENRLARADFYTGLDEIHNPQRSPHIDLRTLNNAIGEIVIRSQATEGEHNIISLDLVKDTLIQYDISPTLINNGLQAVKQVIRRHIREGKTSISVEEVTEELDKLSSITEKDLMSIVRSFENLEKHDDETFNEIYEVVKPSYESLLEVAYQ